MFSHNHLNSKTLKKDHREIYADFFSQNPLIVSCPSTLLWTPIYSIGVGGIAISSKLPARHYAGFKQSKTKTNGLLVKITSQKKYFPEQKNFHEEESLTYWNDKVAWTFDNFLKKQGIKEKVEVELLEESPVARGWHTTQSMICAITAGLFLWHGICKKEDIEKWKTIETSKLWEDKKFNQIVRLAWQACSIAIETFEDGHGIFSALFDSTYPVVCYHEKDPYHFDRYKDLGLDHPDSYYNFSNKIWWRAMRLNEVLDIPKETHWALEYAILYAGGECPSRYVYKAQVKYDERLTYLSQFIKRTFEKTVPKNSKLPYFLEPSFSKDESPGMVLFKKYREASVVLSSEFIRHFYELYRTGYVFDKMREFFKVVNLCETQAKVLGQVSYQIDDVCSVLNRNARIVNNLGAGVKLISEGVTGDILIVGPYNTVRRTIEKSQDEVEKLTSQPLYCEYASWCDGSENEGMKIEQSLSDKVFSEFVNEGSVTIKEWRDNKQMTCLYGKNEWQKKQKDFDLLFDPIFGKIYVRGKILSSKDIHSTKQTIEIFKSFFEKENNMIENKDLPSSCYKQDRNQMESKIVRPLQGVVKKLLGKKLDFRVTGGLGSQFSIIFQPENLKIGFVKQIN